MRGEETDVPNPPNKKRKPDATDGWSSGEDDEYEQGRVYGGTGGAGHGHGGPGL
jgi:hypothetical protein